MIQSDVFHCKSECFPKTFAKIRFNFEPSIAYSFRVQIPMNTFFPSIFAKSTPLSAHLAFAGWEDRREREGSAAHECASS
jgi:hypothetical protein